ncbi:MAG: lipoyl domain-containing protein [Armatimonadetes bacterium]|nr:lipoyl domain-containing protein [Armatimonadota bacterium]
MSVEVRIPDYGEAKCSTKLSFWYKDEGEAVKQGEELAEFETDKAAFTIEAPVTGTLARILIGEGDEITQGALIALIDPGE